jgi:hypothetical protein
MHFAGTVAAVGRNSMSISGASLNATAVAGTATSPGSTTINVPNGHTGQFRITWVDVGTVLLAQLNLAGAGFSSFINGELFVTSTASILLRTTGCNAGESRTYTITDYLTSKVIATVVHTGA